MVISAGDPLGPDGPGPTARARRPGTASYFQDINIETVSNEYSYGEHPRLIFLKDLNSEIKASNLKSYIEKLLYFCRTKSKLHASRPHLTLPLASLALSITYSSPFTRKQSFDSSVEFLQFQFGLKGRFCVSSCFKILLLQYCIPVDFDMGNALDCCKPQSSSYVPVSFKKRDDIFQRLQNEGLIRCKLCAAPCVMAAELTKNVLVGFATIQNPPMNLQSALLSPRTLPLQGGQCSNMLAVCPSRLALNP